MSSLSAYILFLWGFSLIFLQPKESKCSLRVGKKIYYSQIDPNSQIILPYIWNFKVEFINLNLIWLLLCLWFDYPSPNQWVTWLTLTAERSSYVIEKEEGITAHHLIIQNTLYKDNLSLSFKKIIYPLSFLAAIPFLFLTNFLRVIVNYFSFSTTLSSIQIQRAYICSREI